MSDMHMSMYNEYVHAHSVIALCCLPRGPHAHWFLGNLSRSGLLEVSVLMAVPHGGYKHVHTLPTSTSGQQPAHHVLACVI